MLPKERLGVLYQNSAKLQNETVNIFLDLINLLTQSFPSTIYDVSVATFYKTISYKFIQYIAEKIQM